MSGFILKSGDLKARILVPESYRYKMEFNHMGYTWIDADEYVAIVREAIAAQEQPPLQTAP